MMPKVLVGCPTSNLYEYCFDEYVEAVKSLNYQNYDLLLVDNSKDNKFYKRIRKLGISSIKDKYREKAIDRIVSSRNILRQYALDNNYDYLLSLEQDVIPPLDIIDRLLSHNKKVVSAVYFTYRSFDNRLELVPLAYKQLTKDKMRHLTDEELSNNKLQKVFSSGLGCLLIHKSVLEKIKFRYEQSVAAFDDILFCLDLRNNNIDLYIDTSVKCKHLVLKRPWNWSQLT